LVRLHPEAEPEFRALVARERAAMATAIARLQEFGIALGFPHTSKVQGADDLRELRPRAGRSAWRAFYRRIGDVLIVGAVGPEAQSNPQGFRAAVRDAERRLNEMEP
jgi:hypothetical protein